MATLSVVIVARDEERNIEPCLRSVSWADETIVVIDDRTVDRTAEVAEPLATRLYCREWLGYGKTKNWAIAQACGDWVLSLDADERVSPPLAGEIRDEVLRAEPIASAYEMARLPYFLGREIRHCGWYPGYVVRLFRRGKVRYDDAFVHESVRVEGEIGRLRSELVHYTDPTIYHYLQKLNRYTSLAAQELLSRGRRGCVRDLLLRPPAFFLRMYLVRGGFLDGMHGFVLSYLSAFYVFVKYAKVMALEWARSGLAQSATESGSE
jgi:glycosyltransferase involved in cell wall biosynthesis